MLIERENDGSFHDIGEDGQEITPKMMPPLSDATNAFELLDDVVTCVEHEPRRLFMADWILRGLKLEAVVAGPKEPACHTGGCLGGWTVTIHDGVDKACALGVGYVENRAREILSGSGFGSGIPHLGVGGLFHGNVYKAELKKGYATPDVEKESFNEQLLDEDADQITYGGRGYAKAVVNRVRRFQAFYGEQLKAVKVSPQK